MTTITTATIVKLEDTDFIHYTTRDGRVVGYRWDKFQGIIHDLADEVKKAREAKTVDQSDEIAQLKAQLAAQTRRANQAESNLIRKNKQLTVKQKQVNAMEEQKVVNRRAIYERDVIINSLQKQLRSNVSVSISYGQ